MSSTVNIFVVSPDTRSERRFDLHITVQQLKVCQGLRNRRGSLNPTTGMLHRDL
nr:ubiquitin-like fold super family protein [Taiwanofungus camphoratus]